MPATNAPLMISPHTNSIPSTPTATPLKQSLHDAPLPAHLMAGGWRGLLEEESEHQWLTLSLFALFVVFGAFAIDATEHFVGDQIVDVEAQHQGGLVTEIEYQDAEGGYTALVFSPSAGYHMFTEDAKGTVTYVFDPLITNEMAAQVNFIKAMPGGERVFSVAPNQLLSLQDNMMITYDYTSFNETFTIQDVADRVGSSSTDRLLLTMEGSSTSFRGVVAGVPTPAMSMSSGVQWHHVESHSDGLWVAIGTHSSTSGADGSSPATPQARPVLGWITWAGDANTPVLRNVQMFGSGVFHGFAESGTELVVGGTVESLVISADEEVKPINAPCALAVSDTDGKVWFIGALGSTNLATYDNGDLEVHQLSRHIPVEVSDAGAQGEHVHVHGTDGEGNPIQWSIDITADGSIESGRGFLNLLFLLSGGILLAMMATHAIEQLRQKA